jgi:hypothetical protein
MEAVQEVRVALAVLVAQRNSQAAEPSFMEKEIHVLHYSGPISNIYLGANKK